SALAAYAEQPWYGTAVVLDIDGHALTLAAVGASEGQAQLLATRVLPHLGLHAWKERLLGALADCCVRQSRRDPRDSPAAEQALYEQPDAVLEGWRQGRMVHLAVQMEQWYQNLVLDPEQPAGFCAALARAALAETHALLSAAALPGPPQAVLLTA